MKSKGFTLIELLIVIAILGIIAAVLIPGISGIFNVTGNTTDNGAINETAVTNNETTFRELAAQPISSLNLTELEFMAGYCLRYDTSIHWLIRASLYQNQIIINELKERP